MAPNRGLGSNYPGYRGMANRLWAKNTSQDVHWPVSCSSAHQSPPFTHTYTQKNFVLNTLSLNSDSPGTASVCHVLHLNIICCYANMQISSREKKRVKSKNKNSNLCFYFPLFFSFSLCFMVYCFLMLLEYQGPLVCWLPGLQHNLPQSPSWHPWWSI